ncbi:TIGR04222 domain-containing membrane protein [Nonomuraea rubra]|uniref:TIGR04222 domain-containing membrane protein n=1 Tax=Nonomuraea rubra TaxID=46180 RepID=UPI0033E73CC2
MVVIVAAVLALGLVAVVALVLVECLLRWRLRHGPADELRSACELAVFIKGRHSLAHTAITALVRRNAVRESRSGLCTAVAGASAGEPAERLALDFLAARAGRATRWEITAAPGWPPLEARMRAELVRRGLLRPGWMSWTLILSGLTVIPVLCTNISTFLLAIDTAGDLLTGEPVWPRLGQWWPALLAPPLTVAFLMVIEWMRTPGDDKTLLGEAVYQQVLAAHPDHDGSLESYVIRGERPPETVPAPAAAPERGGADDDGDGGGDAGGDGGCGCGGGDA